MRGWQDYNLPDAMFAPIQRPFLAIVNAAIERYNICQQLYSDSRQIPFTPHPLYSEDLEIFGLGVDNIYRDGVNVIYDWWYYAFYAGINFLGYLASCHGWTYTDDPMASYAPQLTALLGETWIDWETPTIAAMEGRGDQVFEIAPTAKILEQTCRIVDSLRAAVWIDDGITHRVDITDQVQFLLD